MTLLGGKAGRARAGRRGLQPRAPGAAPPQQADRGEHAGSAAPLERALERDPDYAEAWDALAVVHMRELRAGADASRPRKRPSGSRNGRSSGRSASTPSMAEAHARLARLRRLRWDFAGADRSMKRALELAPGSSFVIASAAGLASTFGRFDEAIALQKRALGDRPPEPHRLVQPRLSLPRRRPSDGGGSDAQEAPRAEPGRLRRARPAGRCLSPAGAGRGGARGVREGGGSVRAPRRPGHGPPSPRRDRAASEAALRGAGDEVRRPGEVIAAVHAYRGEIDQAFAWLERAYQQRDPGPRLSQAGLVSDPLHADPRWGALLKKVGLPTE